MKHSRLTEDGHYCIDQNEDNICCPSQLEALTSFLITDHVHVLSYSQSWTPTQDWEAMYLFLQIKTWPFSTVSHMPQIQHSTGLLPCATMPYGFITHYIAHNMLSILYKVQAMHCTKPDEWWTKHDVINGLKGRDIPQGLGFFPSPPNSM